MTNGFRGRTDEILRDLREELRLRRFGADFTDTFIGERGHALFKIHSIWRNSWDKRLDVTLVPQVEPDRLPVRSEGERLGREAALLLMTEAVTELKRELESWWFKVKLERYYSQSYTCPAGAGLVLTLRVDCRPFGRWPREPEEFELEFRLHDTAPACEIQERTEEVLVAATEERRETRRRLVAVCRDPLTGGVVSETEVR